MTDEKQKITETLKRNGDILKEAIETRDGIYQEQTQLILHTIQPILDGIEQFIQSRMSDGIIVEFESVDIINEMVIISGTADYEIDTTLMSEDGELVTVTEDNIEDFKHVVRVGLPLSVVSSNNSELIQDFLLQVVEKGEDLTQNQTPTEFDTDSLTPEQQEALKLFSKTNGDFNDPNS